MTKHDTWVQLNCNSSLDDYLYLFPDGIPMGDPFPMQWTTTQSGEIIALWVIDLDRPNHRQFAALTTAIAIKFNVAAIKVVAEAVANGGEAADGEWAASRKCGEEGMQRTKELADF
ncbi:hypothetical protein [Microseira wollei]|uniref:Uncharacterized protein n=1 Tax=Microseira wollei NIES-4236 TaxID=2530354 RepID=A0AAV3XS57_9CYAN|nr:hypothetical protein [Microseira wollei]GET44160.1 hypothetical protein MiSe_89860 [Microseira wollei NIES-4236]